jgi:hypothetical protein
MEIEDRIKTAAEKFVQDWFKTNEKNDMFAGMIRHAFITGAKSYEQMLSNDVDIETLTNEFDDTKKKSVSRYDISTQQVKITVENVRLSRIEQTRVFNAMQHAYRIIKHAIRKSDEHGDND